MENLKTLPFITIILARKSNHERLITDNIIDFRLATMLREFQSRKKTECVFVELRTAN